MTPQEQLKFFELPEIPKRKHYVRRLKHPIWTENKAKLIERYLFYFVLITKHGVYIDGFAGPQNPEKTHMWSAKLVLEYKPRWLRQFHLFDSNPEQIKYLEELKAAQPPRKTGEPKREVNIYPGDFNLLLPNLLKKKPISEKEATFCLLDQRTFECQWKTVEALSTYKSSGMKIEIFYFLAEGWLGRAIAAQKNTEVLDLWWRNKDWKILRRMKRFERALFLADRFQNELGYESALPWPIHEKKNGGRVMYYMIHATDHPEAPNLMHRAYHKAVSPIENPQQFLFEFNEWKTCR